MKNCIIITSIVIITPFLCIGGPSRKYVGGYKDISEIQAAQRREKQEKQRRRNEANLAKIKKTNATKSIDIKGLAGFIFGRKYEDVTMMPLAKPSFLRYTYVTLKSSPAYGGLFSITLTTNDPMIHTKEQTKAEIIRMANIFGNKFKIMFTSDIAEGSNAKLGRRFGVSDRTDSITGGIKGYSIREETYISEPATEIYMTLQENFRNCTIKIKGTYYINLSKAKVEVTVDMN